MKKIAVVNIAMAKARLSELVERAARGEEIIVARNGKPKARLVPIAEKKRFVSGSGRGQWKGVERLLGMPLPADALSAFYADEDSSADLEPH